MLDPLMSQLESAGLPGVEIHPDSFTVLENIDEPYVAEVEVTIEASDTDVALMLGQDCVLSLVRAPDLMRRFCGVVRAVTERDMVQNDRTSARLVVVPALWMLGSRRDTRIFQEKTVPEILEEVLTEALGPYGREIRDELQESYPAREYCVQYQESDLDFVHRLMQEEGIHYGFDHEGEVEVMVLRDRNEAFPRLPTAPEGGSVEFRPDDLYVRHTEPLSFVAEQSRLGTTSVVVNDWDWTRADMPFENEARAQDAMSRDRESYEHGLGRNVTIHSYSGTSYGATDLDRQVRIRQEAHRESERTIYGVGKVTGMSPGLTFELTGHPTPGLDGEYVITRVRHESHPVEAVLGLEHDGRESYHSRFEAIPIDVTHRPARRTRKPFVPSIQTAVVTGPSGEEIHVDEHGRIKVQFHWDRDGQYDERTSCWIRVQQPWSGAGWGFWYVPRIGMEVVVQFVDGDPDRPMVTGCVYDGSNALPYPLPDEKTKSTMKSNSSLGGGGFNEFRFEDEAGAEQIYTHAQKDYDEVVENDHTTHVLHDQTNTVDNDQTQTVGNDQTVHANQRMTVDGNRTVHVKGDFDETVDGTETRNVVSDVSETFDANEARTIASNVDESVGADETRTIGGNQSETVTGNVTRSITGSSTETVGGSLTQSATGGFTSTTPAAHSVTAVGGWNVTAAGGITFTAPGGMTVVAPGGVTHVDQTDSWMGGLQDKVAFISVGVTYHKMEAVGINIGTVTSLKAEGAGLVCETNTLELEKNDMSKIKTVPSRLKSRFKMSFKTWKNEG